jgi:hypothetical protein
VVFSDGAQNVTLVNCDATAGLLGGVAMFSSATRISGAKLNLTNTKFTTLGDTMPGLWFGNVIANAYLTNAEIDTKSDVLVVANYSQITQDFDYYAGYPDNNNLKSAEVTIQVKESDLKGHLVAYNGSFISWSLNDYSTWRGAPYSGYGDVTIDVSLDKTSTWSMTRDATVNKFMDADSSLENIHSGGHTLYYNATENEWLKGRTVHLSGGGETRPVEEGHGHHRKGGRAWSA